MSQINWNRQLGLALSLFVLGTGVYWLEYKHKPEREATEDQKKHLFDLQKTPVQSIALIDGTQPQGQSKATQKTLSGVTFQCQDFAAKLCKPGDSSKWELTEPLKTQADDSSVNTLLSSLSSLMPSEVIDLKDETAEKKAALLKDYGLDPESQKLAKKVQISTEKGTTTLTLGIAHPMGETLFALKEEGHPETFVYLIPNHFKGNLDHDLNYWRNKKLFSFVSQEITSFRLKGKKGDFSADLKANQWNLQSGSQEVMGDTNAFTSYLSSVAASSAKAIAAESYESPEAKSLLKSFTPSLKLDLQQSKGNEKDVPAPIILTLFEAKSSQPRGKLYATVSGRKPLYEMETTAMTSLDKSFEQMRLTRLMSAGEQYGIKRIEFSGSPLGPTPVILIQKNGNWVFESNSTEFPVTKINPIFEKLTAHHAIQEFIQARSAPSGEKDGLTVLLGDETTSKKRHYVFWKSKTQLYARDLLSKHNEVYRIDSPTLDVLPWDSGFFKPAEPKAPPQPEPSHK